MNKKCAFVDIINLISLLQSYKFYKFSKANSNFHSFNFELKDTKDWCFRFF